MRVKYIRDHVFGVQCTQNGPQLTMRRHPVACVVQDDEGRIGISVCHTDYIVNVDDEFFGDVTVLPGDAFSKAKAKLIATARASKGIKTKVPNRKITNVHGKRVRLVDEVSFWEEKFREQDAIQSV